MKKILVVGRPFRFDAYVRSDKYKVTLKPLVVSQYPSGQVFADSIEAASAAAYTMRRPVDIVKLKRNPSASDCFNLSEYDHVYVYINDVPREVVIQKKVEIASPAVRSTARPKVKRAPARAHTTTRRNTDELGSLAGESTLAGFVPPSSTRTRRPAARPSIRTTRPRPVVGAGFTDASNYTDDPDFDPLNPLD